VKEHFFANVVDEASGVVKVEIGFCEPAENTTLVPEAIHAVRALALKGGAGIHFSGPASLPVAMALAHLVAHLFGYVACWDPKLSGYVVAISHDPEVPPGRLITT
jgi:CRISPR-associated protein Csx3